MHATEGVAQFMQHYASENDAHQRQTTLPALAVLCAADSVSHTNASRKRK